MTSARYAPEFFNRSSLEEARGVILTPSGGLSLDERWEVETDWLTKRIHFPDDGIVVDYGCGIGRMAKAIQRPVIGVDISLPMLEWAIRHVDRQDFIPMSPAAFRNLVGSGFRACGAMAIWSLQHVLDLEDTVGMLMMGLQIEASFWMLDLCERHVPAQLDGNFCMWADSKNVLELLEPWCELESTEKLDVWKEDPGHNGGALYKFRRTEKS